MVQKGETNLTISDKIATDTEFYFREFHVHASKMATIEYSIKLNKTNIGIHCVEYDKCEVTLDIYTTKDDQNLKKNCSVNTFGQVFNENLVTPMRSRSKPYRFTTCKLDDVDSDMLHCKGTATIQDYVPRNYGFSFGYDCMYSDRPSLRGLSFNFTISEQTNETSCINTPNWNDGFLNCHQLYTYTSLPNMIGFPNTALIKQRGEASVFSSIAGLTLASNGRLCHKYARELLCLILYPKCEVNQQVIHPCKESCYEFIEVCAEMFFSEIRKLTFAASYYSRKLAMDKLLENKLFHCAYLPSHNGPIPCFYKPVICEYAPNVPNATMTNGSNPNGIYVAMSQVKYKCFDGFIMEGNNTVTCLYNGRWEKIPRCLERKDKSLNPLNIVIPLLMAPLFVIIISHIVKRFVCPIKRSQDCFTRTKEYDAFVCYEYNKMDQGFAENFIRVELEEKCDPPFKLCLHRRDFKAAWDIMWNIRNAIQNSNSAIIVMSQEYVDSLWCKEEFEQCYMEHMKDAAFKLFVIMMRPVEELNGTSEYMKSFFESKTYLEQDDPNLYRKIGDYLSCVKKANGIRNRQPAEAHEIEEVEEMV